MSPQQLKELKAITAKWDEQRTRAMADEDLSSLWDHAQHLFGALSIPFGLACLLRHLLAVDHAHAPSETLLMKVLVVGQKKSLEAASQQIWDFGMELPPPPPPYK